MQKFLMWRDDFYLITGDHFEALLLNDFVGYHLHSQRHDNDLKQHIEEYKKEGKYDIADKLKKKLTNGKIFRRVRHIEKETHGFIKKSMASKCIQSLVKKHFLTEHNEKGRHGIKYYTVNVDAIQTALILVNSSLGKEFPIPSDEVVSMWWTVASTSWTHINIINNNLINKLSKDNLLIHEGSLTESECSSPIGSNIQNNHPLTDYIVGVIANKKSLAPYALTPKGVDFLNEVFVEHFPYIKEPLRKKEVTSLKPLNKNAAARAVWRVVSSLAQERKWDGHLLKNNIEYQKVLLTFINTFGEIPQDEHIAFIEEAYQKPNLTSSVICHTFISYFDKNRALGQISELKDELMIQYQLYQQNRINHASQIAKQKSQELQKQKYKKADISDFDQFE